ncbi:MAG: hypothetical protein ACP5SH_06900 [Syntrophobacteraceae bacterium]
MAGEQATIPSPVSPTGGEGGVGQTSEAARLEVTSGANASAPGAAGTKGASATWFRGILLRRRCDSCGTRIDILAEGEDRVFMRCPECLREYVFSQRPE